MNSPDNTFGGEQARLGNLISKPGYARSRDVSNRTVSRWMDDPDLNFPQPVVINNRNYFRLEDIAAWEAEQVRKSAARRASFRARSAEAAA